MTAIAVLMLAACSPQPTPPPEPPPAPTLAVTPEQDFTAIKVTLDELLRGYRAIIVLLADEKSMSPAEFARAEQVGQVIFQEDIDLTAKLDSNLGTLLTASGSARFSVIESLLNYVESADGLYDADRLAFREVLVDLQQRIGSEGSLPAIKLHKRIGEDLDALAEIQRNYDGELKAIFNRFAPRAIALKRERWNDYVAHLKKMRTREQILKDYGVIVAQPSASADTVRRPRPEAEEFFGLSLPAKTVVLTFDDGPHPRYTAEIAAILQQYGVPAVFFEVGRNLGSVGGGGEARLGSLASVSRQLRADGFVIGNHSYTHAQLSKLSGQALNQEISATDSLLHALDEHRAPLFRFPYGARNAADMDALRALKLRSIMWSIDSLDWADPVPNSIVERVVNQVEHAGRGVILFHDIHERAVEALPKVLERLSADGFRFAGWDGTGFTVAKDAGPSPERSAVTSSYAASWALIVGIDAYEQWPKLQYAVNDAKAVKNELVDHYGFAEDHVIVLTDQEATRNGILAAFETRLAQAVRKDDRLLVFFAGHGATRQLSSGRNLGYIIPSDSDPGQIAATAIPMTEIQNIAEGLVAKHILFVMDACYSGLGLTRGGMASSRNFLTDNARRVGRQMLTAGGADQMVADSGPNGHSVFTWAVLQGLGGKADLNGDGIVTATELAAYVAPAVAGTSHQTPAFGSLPGSEGGEFILELPEQTEYLNPGTEQMSGDALRLSGALDAAATMKGTEAPVTVTDLQGGARQVEVPKAVAVGVRKLAQLANDRGLQFYREQRYADAEAQFTQALKQRPDFAQAANNLGFVFYKQNKFREAARWFENTVKIDPSRAVAYLNLGDAYAHDAQTDKARAAYQTFLALSPSASAAADVRAKLEALGRSTP